MIHYRHALALAAVLLLVGLSGCATIEVTSEVGGEDTIERYEMNITTSTTVYGFLNEGAKDDGYEDFEDSVKSESEVDEEKITYSEEIEGDTAKISVLMTDVSPANVDNVTVETDEETGELVYEDRTFYTEPGEEDEGSEMGEELLSGFVLKYTLVMPGEITETNADEVDGNTATWQRTGADAMGNTTVRARSESPSPIGAPGFGVAAAMLGLLVGAILVAARAGR